MAANDAAIEADVFGPPVVPSEGSFSANALGKIKLLRSQLGLEKFSSLSEMLSLPGLECVFIFKFSWATPVCLHENVVDDGAIVSLSDVL